MSKKYAENPINTLYKFVNFFADYHTAGFKATPASIGETFYLNVYRFTDDSASLNADQVRRHARQDPTGIDLLVSWEFYDEMKGSWVGFADILPSGEIRETQPHLVDRQYATARSLTAKFEAEYKAHLESEKIAAQPESSTVYESPGKAVNARFQFDFTAWKIDAGTRFSGLIPVETILARHMPIVLELIEEVYQAGIDEGKEIQANAEWLEPGETVKIISTFLEGKTLDDFEAIPFDNGPTHQKPEFQAGLISSGTLDERDLILAYLSHLNADPQ